MTDPTYLAIYLLGCASGVSLTVIMLALWRVVRGTRR